MYGRYFGAFGYGMLGKVISLLSPIFADQLLIFGMLL